MANFTVSIATGFVDPSGKSWSMRGLNAQVPDAIAGFPNVMTDYPGLTAIRLAASSGGPFNAKDSLETIQKIVSDYTGRGVVVELELHYGNGYESDVGWYQQMAQAFKGNPLVFLETPNEPTSDRTATIQNQINIINAIRATGFTNPIGLQPWGGWDSSTYDGVLNAVGTQNIFATPHIYGANWGQTAIDQAASRGLFSSIDEFGNAIDGVHLDAVGNEVINGTIALNQAGKAGAVFWAMDNGNHPDGADSAFLTPDGSQLTSTGRMIQPWLSGGGQVIPGPSEPPPPPPGPVTIGDGSDTLTLGISEDKYLADAQFTIAVDGKQLGVTQTASAIHGSSSQPFIVKGDWAPGVHTVTVNFLNDAWGGTAATDRNLSVDSISENGVNISQSSILFAAGPKTFSFSDNTPVGGSTPPPPPTPDTVVGTGSDSLKLSISEDAYLGDAQFTVSVDGKQIGGTQTAKVLHSSEDEQLFTFKGDFGVGNHTVAVNFLNDAWGGTPATDRNLFVDKAIYDGADTGKALNLFAPGSQSFAVSDITSVEPPPVTTHQLVLTLAEDRFNGDAKFIAKVDGKSIGSGTVTAQENKGQTQDFTFSGQWAAGKHDLEIDFTNDAYGGSRSTDRNLWIDGIKYDGVSSLDHHVIQWVNGAVHFEIGS